MKIIHHFRSCATPFTNPPRQWVETMCEPDRIVKDDRRGKYTLGDAIKQLEYSPESVLCAPCFYQAVGQIKFDQEPTYSEELASQLNQDDEIVDVEEL